LIAGLSSFWPTKGITQRANTIATQQATQDALKELFKGKLCEKKTQIVVQRIFDKRFIIKLFPLDLFSEYK